MACYASAFTLQPSALLAGSSAPRPPQEQLQREREATLQAKRVGELERARRLQVRCLAG